MKLAVIGAGVTGITSAYFLRQSGHEVTVIDANMHPAMLASHANGGQLSASNSEVWNSWANVAKGIAWSFKRDAPLKMRYDLDFAKYKWLIQFMANIKHAKENTMTTTEMAMHSIRIMRTEFEDIEYSAIGLSSLVTFLSNIFVWREWDHRSDLILMTDERAIAKQRLHLSLEHAQQGLLSQDGIVYKHSLMRAKDLFAMLGNENSVVGESLMAELEDLVMIKIDPEAPSLEGPLQLMNQLTLRFHDLK